MIGGRRKRVHKGRVNFRIESAYIPYLQLILFLPDSPGHPFTLDA